VTTATVLTCLKEEDRVLTERMDMQYMIFDYMKLHAEEMSRERRVALYFQFLGTLTTFMPKA
jgi:hypothetical protein